MPEHSSSDDRRRGNIQRPGLRTGQQCSVSDDATKPLAGPPKGRHTGSRQLPALDLFRGSTQDNHSRVMAGQSTAASAVLVGLQKTHSCSPGAPAAPADHSRPGTLPAPAPRAESKASEDDASHQLSSAPAPQAEAPVEPGGGTQSGVAGVPGSSTSTTAATAEVSEALGSSMAAGFRAAPLGSAEVAAKEGAESGQGSGLWRSTPGSLLEDGSLFKKRRWSLLSVAPTPQPLQNPACSPCTMSENSRLW